MRLAGSDGLYSGSATLIPYCWLQSIVLRENGSEGNASNGTTDAGCVMASHVTWILDLYAIDGGSHMEPDRLSRFHTSLLFTWSRGQPGMWKKANVRPSVFLASIDLNHSSRDHKVSPTTLETRIFEAELPTFADI